MELMYASTRDANEKVTASQAILKGLANDGGLYVPTEIPSLDVSMEELSKMTYQETAYEVLKLFLTDYTEEELKNCINAAYDSKFDTEEIAPLVDADGAYYLELFHGPTIAFKDMALSILPHLLITAARKNNVKNDIVILTATSGDTGKAALAGFADVKGTKIIVFYPKNGVSPVQEKQMVTQKGDNTFVVGIHGNFDQAQTGVKKMFSDTELAKEMDAAGYQFSSANSINIGRLVPQIAYYVYAYAKLYANGVIAKDEKINIVVPTGNFGNILAAFYAKNMGIPVAKLICASNENKVLYDFFSTGTYDKNREFMLTSSPSMDILISSNLERLIYRIAGEDAAKNAALMKELNTTGKYEITSEMKEKLADFYGNYASEKETADTIRDLYEKTGYVIDTHTAVAASVYHKYKKDTNDAETKTVIASTASPFKFSRSVMDAIDPKYDSLSEFELVDELSKIGNVKIPQAIEEILVFALEMRRRVKEQLKKLGGMEFYDVNFSYIDLDTFEEKFVSVPEQGGGKLIPDGMCNPGQIYTVSRGKSGMIGVFRLESQMLPGSGKFERTGLGSDRDCKESTNTAFNFLKANGKRISGGISTASKDYIINYQDLQGIGMTGKLALPTLIALCSIALGRPTVSTLAVLGEISISGTILKVDELANSLQVCLDSGAKKVLLPITSAADLGTVPPELVGSFNLIFYSSAEDAVFKALGVE